MSAINVEMKAGKAYISSPYNADFVHRIKLIGAKWDALTRRWVVKDDALDAARQVMMEVYGEADVSPAAETVTLVLEFHAEMFKALGPIIIAGKNVASARSRDSGARVGGDTAFIKGAPESGGSAKNWGTCIPEGCVCEIYRVPKAVAEATVANTGAAYTAHIKGDVKVDREKLIAEKQALLARLSEINHLLCE